MQSLRENHHISHVETKALEASRYDAPCYEGERIQAIVVPSFPELGRLTALRFVEWVQANPGGVISLPTGKTPEHFIENVRRLIAGWQRDEVQDELRAAGIDPALRPDMESLHFVQIDEFYPMSPDRKSSFYKYVMQYYIDGFGLDVDKALLINCEQIGLRPGQTLDELWPGGTVDLSLRYRHADTELERLQQAAIHRIDQWCQDYEQRIRDLGGIGFFLGGIGPDGHVGFNVRGSDHYTTTRLTRLNFDSQAAAASDLGGIEIARSRLVITIGLGTITYNPACTAIIMAAGAAKAGVVSDAMQRQPDVLFPATALHALPEAAFYLTEGAASGLQGRRAHVLESAPSLPEREAEDILIDQAVTAGKRLVDVESSDCEGDIFGRLLLQRCPRPLKDFAPVVRDRLIERIERGTSVRSDQRFLHTEPHHDDVMLGYLPAVVRAVRDASNVHHFATMTSGFTSVTHAHLADRIEKMLDYGTSDECRQLHREGYFQPENTSSRNRDIWQYLDGVAARDEEVHAVGEARRAFRDVAELIHSTEIFSVLQRGREILKYLDKAHPGEKDPPDVQRLKGMCREWEVECLWGYFGWSCESIHHLRLGFYKGDVFTEDPTRERDVPPVLDLLGQVRPDVLTVALDPEASGPDTHYKVLQAVTEAVRAHVEQVPDAQEMTVWGYRNVWYRFTPAEADLYVPVSLNMLAIMENSFLHSFISQKTASFPSYEYDGPFCDLARRIQVDQYRTIKTCLGRDWFQEHASPMIRATRGLVFLKELNLADFFAWSRALKQATENR